MVWALKQSATPEIVKTVSVSLLGGFALEVDGASLTDDINRSLKLWSVLAYLTLHRERAVPQSEFIELFWPDDHSSNPVNALKTLLYRIRAMLEPLFGQEIQPILSQRGAYILEVRRAIRSGTCVHLCLITVSLPDGGMPQLKVLSNTMDQLLDVLVNNLRRGDVVSKFSGAQYVIMLPAANYEDSNMVMDRVVRAFYQQHRRSFLKLTVRVRELELN